MTTDELTPDGGASDPHDNSAHDPNFHGATDNVENLPTGGADGTVPKASGGSLSMDTISGSPLSEDSNSPHSASGVQVASFSISDSHDIYKTRFLVTQTNGTEVTTYFRFSGDNNSEYWYQDGTNKTDNDPIEVWTPQSQDATFSFEVILVQADGQVGFTVNSPGQTGSAEAVYGTDYSEAWPPDNIDVWIASGSMDVTGRVYGESL